MIIIFGVVVEFGALIKGEIENFSFSEHKMKGVNFVGKFFIIFYMVVVWGVNKGWNRKNKTFPSSGHMMKRVNFMLNIFIIFGMVVEFGALIKGEIEKPKLSPFQDIKRRGWFLCDKFSLFRHGGRVWDVNKGWNRKTETFLSSASKMKEWILWA